MLFTISGLGEGYRTVSFGEGFIFTSRKFQGQSYVFAYDMNGNLCGRVATARHGILVHPGLRHIQDPGALRHMITGEYTI